MSKKCELCDKAARMYCVSDQASLCWDCDARVHTANFLVAKHVRTLLCHTCQGPTPWTGSGSNLTLTVSLCQDCVNRKEHHDNDDDDDDDEDDQNAQQVTDHTDDGENQVVPLSLSLAPSFDSSSYSDEAGQTTNFPTSILGTPTGSC